MSVLSILNKRPCIPGDLSIMYLETRLKRLERKTQKPNATKSDYIARDRVAIQLNEAKSYLC